MSASPASRAWLWAWFHFVRSLRRPGTLLWILGIGVVGGGIRLAGGSTTTIADLVVLYAVPLAGLSYGTSALREEIEDQTLTYVFTRPIDRAWVYAARMAAAIGVTALVGLVGALVTVRSFGGGMSTIGAALGSAAAYTAFFGLCGLLLRRPTAFGLVFAIAWESGLGAVPGYLSQLTVRTHLRNIAGLRPSNPLLAGLWSPPAVWVSVLVIVGVTAAAIAIGAVLAKRREFVITR